MKNKFLIIIFALAATIIGGSFLYTSLTKNAAVPEIDITPQANAENPDGEELYAPDFTVYDANGNLARLSDFYGNPVVLNFWASWCPPCKEEMPAFDALFGELGDKVKFMMVCAVDGSRETQNTGAAFIEGAGYSFPVYYDNDREAAAAYGIRALPTSIFIDSAGIVQGGVEGAIFEETLRTGIELINK